MQALVLRGLQTSEGTIIEAVTVPWFDLIEKVLKDPSAAFQIPARTWEEIIAGAYHKVGFEHVTLTPRSGDHGRDVIAIKRGIGSVRLIDQVKAFKPDHLVTAHDARAMVGVLQGDGASKRFITTTSGFAPKIMDDPLMKLVVPSRLELIVCSTSRGA
jgi:restriction system protein